jgi:hypothetical protein
MEDKVQVAWSFVPWVRVQFNATLDKQQTAIATRLVSLYVGVTDSLEGMSIWSDG